MDDYNIILNEIKKDLQRENILQENNIISLYELYYILKLKFEKLHMIIKDDKLFNNMFSRKKRISYSIDSKKITLNIKSEFDSFNIVKGFDERKITFSPKTQKSEKFIKKYYGVIVDLFNIIEEYIPLIKILDKPIGGSNEFKYYNLKIALYSLSNIDIRTNIDDNDLNLNYYNKQDLIGLLEESKYELSRKIKVDINILNENLKNVVMDYFYSSRKNIKSK